MKGHFGVYGGQFVPETLMYPLEELEEAYKRLRRILRFRHGWSTSSTIIPAGRHLSITPSDCPQRGVAARSTSSAKI